MHFSAFRIWQSLTTNGATCTWNFGASSETVRNQMLKLHITNLLRHSPSNFIIIDIEFLCNFISEFYENFGANKGDESVKNTNIKSTYLDSSIFRCQKGLFQSSYSRTDQDFVASLNFQLHLEFFQKRSCQTMSVLSSS